MDAAAIRTGVNTFIVVLTAAVTTFYYSNIDPRLRVVNTPNEQIQESYDFIVVGAGSGGSVVASRLSEVPSWRVLLIEAGGDENVVSDIPNLTYLMWGSSMDWNYTTAPQDNACRATNGSCYWPRGRLLGGSSAFMDNVYTRGNRHDYDGWKTAGNEGWGYDNILPYFRRSEDNRIPRFMGSPFHGEGGPLTVDVNHYLTSIGIGYLNGAKELGMEINVDINGASPIGAVRLPVTIRNGSKCSTAKAYLRPARDRPNLSVVMNALVTQINIDPVSMTATGVTFQRGGHTFYVRANNEVVLSAGSINTPQLLMLSGIGPQDHLEEMGIPVVQNLSVGDNLQDHVTVPMVFTSDPTTTLSVRIELQSFPSILQYAMLQMGPLTSALGIENVIFYNSNQTGVPSEYPDSQIMMTSFVPINLNDNVWAQAAFYLHPQSRGTIRLQSRDPTQPPVIDPNYLSVQSDVEMLIQAMNMSRRIAATQSMSEVGNFFNSSYYPACSSFEDLSYDFFLCLTQEYSVTVYHPAGTCKMGPPTDPTAVVDSRLRVYGVRGLRVVDASVFPTLVSGNLNGPVIALAERASDLIRQDYGSIATFS